MVRAALASRAPDEREVRVAHTMTVKPPEVAQSHVISQLTGPSGAGTRKFQDRRSIWDSALEGSANRS